MVEELEMAKRNVNGSVREPVPFKARSVVVPFGGGRAGLLRFAVRPAVC